MNNNKQNYLLFYSKQCKDCSDFLTDLYKNVELFKKFIRVDVCDARIKIPAYVQAVPTIIVPENGKNNMYGPEDAFRWLDKSSINNMNKNASDAISQSNTIGIAEYDPFAMSGFSDGFSYLNNPEALDKNYSFIGDKNSEMIQPPPDDDVLDDNKLRKNAASRAIEELKAQRDREIPQPLMRQ